MCAQVCGAYVSMLVVLPWCIGHILMVGHIHDAKQMSGGTGQTGDMGAESIASLEEQAARQHVWGVWESFVILVVLGWGTFTIRNRLVSKIEHKKELAIAAWILDLALLLGNRSTAEGLVFFNYYVCTPAYFAYR
jgi:hypothetical protein